MASTRPWQYDWKRPLWQTTQPLVDTDSSRGDSYMFSSSSRPTTTPSSPPATPSKGRTFRDSSVVSVDGQLVDHAAAIVLRDELLDCIPDELYQNDDDDGNARETFVLTVTIVQSHDTDEVCRVGNLLSMEVFRHYHSPEKPPRVVTSRILQWPSVRQSSSPEKPWWEWILLGRRKRVINEGMAAICLCRLPSKDASAERQEALDVLKWLSMGGEQHGSAVSPKRSKAPPSSSVSPSEAATELKLVCMDHNGKLFFYSPWDLLNPKKGQRQHHRDHHNELEDNEYIQQHTRKQDAVDDGMDAFFLGEDLLSKLQRAMFPLSQPQQTLSLSISMNPFSRRQQSQNRDISVWDKAMWSSVVDKASLPFQTKANTVKRCFAVFDLLVVIGQGKKHVGAMSSNAPPSGGVSGGSFSNLSAPSHGLEENEASISSLDPLNIHESAGQEGSRECGGFVTFITLRSFTELRTVYLPFVPERVAPVLWGGMQFAMVLNETHAVLVRTDNGTRLLPGVVLGQPPPLSEVSRTNPDLVPLQRFQILPIQVPVVEMQSQLVAWGMLPESQPNIAICCHESPVVSVFQMSLVSIQYAPIEPLYDRYGYAQNELNQMAVVATEETGYQCASIHLPQGECIDGPWYHVGSGWCLVGCDQGIYFVCFEGATSLTGAHVEQIADNSSGPDNEWYRHLVCDIASVDPFACRTSFGLVEELEIPVISDFSRTRQILGYDDMADKNLDEIVLQAIQSLNDSRFHRLGSTVSPREKFHRLLRHCSSWKHLEESETLRQRFEQQLPGVAIRLGRASTPQFLLSLRKSSIPRRVPIRLQSVLSWLASNEDYFAAASLALDLLQDVNSLSHLWKAFERIDSDDDLALLEGLLDGILDITIDSDDSEESIATQLADMTIGCLIEGGLKMASTLSLFLQKDTHYHPARICLMLAAVTSASRSTFEVPIRHDGGKTTYEPVLWPVEALLQVGTSRDCLETSILLLNATIPDELRCRQRTDVLSAPLPSMKLSKALVRLVVASSDQAAQILLNLVDEQSNRSFWESLDDPTSQELALLEVDGRFPLLKYLPVRKWATTYLWRRLEHPSPDGGVPFIGWYQRLAWSCLTNAGCAYVMENNTGSGVEEGAEKTNDNVLSPYKQATCTLRRLLLAAPGSGGLDFDLLIPALLLLEQTEAQFVQGSKYGTQDVLNAVCYLAGRKNAEPPLFEMDGPTLMRECFLANNVMAGANLIGGKNGLVLQCCQLLIQEQGMAMRDAETFLTNDELADAGTVLETDENFVTRECHLLLLFLLNEHVLSIRKYGDFDATHSRDRVDPAWAARTILRTWWKVNVNVHTAATQWLTEWLSDHLELADAPSPYRLACAALARALIWPSSRDSEALAERLDCPNPFLIRLSLSCCGLVESLPSHVIRDGWKEGMIPGSFHSSKRVKLRRHSSGSARSSSKSYTDGMDDSFRSAVSSLDM